MEGWIHRNEIIDHDFYVKVIGEYHLYISRTKDDNKVWSFKIWHRFKNIYNMDLTRTEWINIVVTDSQESFETPELAQKACLDVLKALQHET